MIVVDVQSGRLLETCCKNFLLYQTKKMPVKPTAFEDNVSDDLLKALEDPKNR